MDPGINIHPVAKFREERRPIERIAKLGLLKTGGQVDGYESEKVKESGVKT